MKNKGSKPPAYYPIFLNIQAKKCIVVGGGQVALRKVKILLECGANVVVISPLLHRDLTRLAKDKPIRLIQRDYEHGDLKGAALVVAATDREAINEGIAGEAKGRGILVNVVDNLELSDFIIPSFFRRKDLTVAVSTAGRSPALARKIRTVLERQFGKEYASLLSLIEEVRSGLKRREIVVSPETWQRAIDLDTLFGFLRSGKRKKAKALLSSKLEARKRKK